MSGMRIVGICSSPRHGNTEILVKEALAAASENYNFTTEFISFKGKTILGCTDCKSCITRKTSHISSQCVLNDNWSEIIKPLVDPVPHGLIIGAPVYFGNVNAQLRAFMERCTSLMKGYWHREAPFRPPDWSRTTAGALAVGIHRNGGQELSNENIVQWLLINGFVVVGGHLPNQGPIGYIGATGWEGINGTRSNDAVLDDELGISSARALGKKVGLTAAILAGEKHLKL